MIFSNLCAGSCIACQVHVVVKSHFFKILHIKGLTHNGNTDMIRV
ncbi:hypothetical protein TGS27_1227 [Geobacillus stearothermophilus]|nr:hypothetical protein TGS27_1227 [Geobacillus stearothermophilus]